MSLFNRINTSTPATPSLFGTTNSQPQQTPSLFSPATTPAGGLFGGGGGASSSTPAGTAAPASGSLFGAAPQAPAPTTGGGLFSPAPATAPAGGLFGGGGAATAAPAAGGLFGGAAQATTSAPAAGGGLFGGGAAPAATTAAGGGLFGGGGGGGAAPGGGLFGTPAQKPVGSSLFSPAPATGGNALQTGGGGGAFGLGSSTAQKPGLFGLGGQQQGQQGQQQQQQQQQGQQQQQPGQQQQQQQNVIPAATVDVTRLTATTRFGDCHESVQMELEQLEKHIQDQIRAAQELSALFPRHRTTVESIPSDTKVLAHKLSTTKSFLAADQSTLQAAQQHHASDNDAATLSIRCLDLFRLPPQQRTQYFQRSEQENEVTSNGPMIAYFNSHAAAMDKKLRSFLESVGEVEASLRSVEQQAAVGASGAWVNREDLTGGATGGAGGRQDAMKLNRTLREFNDALKDVSGRIVDVKDGLRELKAGGKR